jgi:hypothetical protein
MNSAFTFKTASSEGGTTDTVFCFGSLMMLLQNDISAVSSDCRNKDTGDAGGMRFGHL